MKKAMMPQYFLRLVDVNNINIEHCTFENTDQSPDQHHIDDRGYGILSFNSDFTMYNDTLRNLTYGVKAYGYDPVNTVSVKNSFFENNKRGMYLGQVNFASVYENKFIVMPVDQENYRFCGLYLEECDGYWVESNEFIKAAGQGTSIGLVVNNSGYNSNEIYRNVFYNLRYGVVAMNYNRDPYGDDGVQLLCNDFSYCGYDISVASDPQNQLPDGIAYYQGSEEPYATATANNIFSYTGNENIPSDINNECDNVIYYFPPIAENLNIEPIYYTQNTIIKLIGGYADFWYYQDGCPPYDPGGGSGTEGLRSQLDLYEQKTDSTENLLQQLVDGGDTEQLQMDVDLSTPPESMEVYNELMNNSPYLSDTVMESAIYKESVLPNTMLRDIMVANPQSAKNDELVGMIDDRWVPMPGYMKTEIMEGLEIVAAKEQLESEKMRYKRLSNHYFNSLVRYFCSDTLLTLQSINDSLIDLFENRNSIYSKYRLAFKYLDQEQYQQGDDMMESIPVMFDLNAAKLAEYQTMDDYFDLISGTLQDSTHLMDPDSTQMLLLHSFYLDGSGVAANYARNILLAHNEIQYEEPIILPYPYKSLIHDEIDFGDHSEEDANNLKVYPNPSNSFLIIEYELGNMPEEAIIAVTEMGGKIVKSIRVNKQMDQHLMDVTDLPQGVYIVSLFINRKQIESVKFTIVR